MANIYIVFGSRGDYVEDVFEWMIKAYRSEDAAQEHVAKAVADEQKWAALVESAHAVLYRMDWADVCAFRKYICPLDSMDLSQLFEPASYRVKPCEAAEDLCSATSI